MQQRQERCNFLEGVDSSEEIIEAFLPLGNPEEAKILSRYFKTGKGEYAEGDIFLGIRVPRTRAFAKLISPCSLATIKFLLIRPEHEVRLLAFILLVEHMKKSKSKAFQKAVYDCYMAHREYCNNWDLVDTSCRDIIPIYWEDKPVAKRIETLLELARSPHLWTQRIAMVSCWGFIRRGSYEETLVLAKELLGHKHDLMHKAVGWMLREMGKNIDEVLLIDFLDEYSSVMPRTMLRYAIEKLSPELRQYYLNKPRKLITK